MAQVLISADATCDIGSALSEKYGIQLMNWKVILEEKIYTDGVDILPEDLYKAWWERKVLPKTSAVAPSEYAGYFQPFIDQGYDIVHICLGSGLTSSFQNACLTAEELGHIYLVDSQNLSTGFGALVIRAAELAQQGMGAPEIQSEIQNMCASAHASFLLDTLEFMRAGGRCSAMARMGASLFNIKPCIEVDNQNHGRMHVGAKYRGQMERCLRLYVQDKLKDRKDLDLDRLFITHSGSPESDIELVKDEIAKYHTFKEIHVTQASCVISTHCGPRTLGILFQTKKDTNTF